MLRRTDALLEVADVARIVDLTPAAVRAAARRGDLHVALTTRRGARLFRLIDVERFAERRARRRA